MSKKKKDDFMFLNDSFSTEELLAASEIIAVVEDMMITNYPKLQFEHMILWWLICEPAEA
jgi:hypothetical protein